MRILSILIAGAMVFVFMASAEAAMIRSDVGNQDYCLAIDGVLPIKPKYNFVIQPCDPNSFKQRWHMRVAGDFVVLKSMLNANGLILCLDGTNAVVWDGTNVQIFGCNQSVAQIWTPGTKTELAKSGSLVTNNQQSTKAPTGPRSRFTFKLGANNAFCLDVAGGVAAPGTNVRLWTCNDLNAQNWYIN